jgi:hypothetical protein
MGKLLQKFMPTRRASEVSENFIADLDALVNEPVYFKVLGKVHKIEPISSETFLRFTNGYHKIMGLNDRKDLTPDDVIDAYYQIFNSVCKTITRKDVENMKQVQIGGVFQVIVDAVTGKIFSPEKKKDMVPLVRIEETAKNESNQSTP